MAEPWLLITLSTSGPSSTLRVHAWRKLHSFGALALAQSVYVVPERPATVRAVNRLLTRVREEGARGRLLHVAFDPREKREVIASFCAERRRSSAKRRLDRAWRFSRLPAVSGSMPTVAVAGRCPLPQAHQPNR